MAAVMSTLAMTWGGVGRSEMAWGITECALSDECTGDEILSGVCQRGVMDASVSAPSSHSGTN